MKLFFALARQSIRRQLAYRATIFAGLATNYIFGILRASILVAFYGGMQAVEGMSVDQVITYCVLSQAAIGFLSLFQWSELMQSIYTGEISSDLLKPISLYQYWLAQDLGRAWVQLLLRGALILVLYELIYVLVHPTTWVQWVLVASSIVLSWLVSFSWRFLVNTVAFWTPDARGIIRLVFGLSWFASGFLMPLRFYPEWVQKICFFTPFPYTANTMVETYLGVLDTNQMVQALVIQMGWVGILGFANYAALRAGVKKLVIQGG